ncbi:MAG: hydrogenase maturation protease [Candidatus Micrarchaeota archaeon]|nr:hydrogenase maturation protease [Candidatus Micrarchaeota archaeon]
MESAMTAWLGKFASGKTLFVGVGNPMNGDDGVGPYMAGKLPHAIDAGNAPENFIGKINSANPESVIFIDAMDFGGKAGEARIMGAKEAKGETFTTHSLPLSSLLRLINCRRVFILGIQPADTTFGAKMSKEVKKSADMAIREIKGILD